MNIAVLSDIHGNYTALKKCMDYLEDKAIDTFIFLGDYTGEFSGIQQVFDLLYSLQKEYPCYIIKGNKEEYQLNGIGDAHPEWDEYPSTVGMIRYANKCLRAADKVFINSLNAVMPVSISGMEDILICHGSPRKMNDKILPGQKENRDMLDVAKQKYILCGHTHKSLSLHEYGKHIFNPGSVGLCMDDDRHDKAAFLILHSDGNRWEPEFISLDYNIDEAINDMRIKGLFEIAPYWSRSTEQYIRGGTNIHGLILERAMELYCETAGKCEWPMIPEECWERAFNELVTSTGYEFR